MCSFKVYTPRCKCSFVEKALGSRGILSFWMVRGTREMPSRERRGEVLSLRKKAEDPRHQSETNHHGKTAPIDLGPLSWEQAGAQ